MADGELRPVKFEVRTPGDPAELDLRCRQNEARGLPEAAPRRTCLIVGSGPSARHEALWERLRTDPEVVSVAVNGALGLFREHDLEPDYWACCDPQDVVLDFIPDHPPKSTTYLLASKCPPALFDKLLGLGYDVRIWRIDDYHRPEGKLAVPCAVSITLVSQSLFRFMGYHRFEMYGWDCCYLDGEHHASRQAEPEQPMTYTIEDQDGTLLHEFRTAGTWLAEINDAHKQTFNLGVMGYSVEVHGPGALAASLKAHKLI